MARPTVDTENTTPVERYYEDHGTGTPVGSSTAGR